VVLRSLPVCAFARSLPLSTRCCCLLAFDCRHVVRRGTHQRTGAEHIRQPVRELCCCTIVVFAAAERRVGWCGRFDCRCRSLHSFCRSGASGPAELDAGSASVPRPIAGTGADGEMN
jgi:hypothetical protein